jgi:hypothetical protein
MQFVRSWFRPSQTTLVSPFLDSMLVGGISIVAFVVLQFAVSRGADIYAWSVALYYAAFLINFPHFMASYLLMYGDARKSFEFRGENKRQTLKMWWAGVIVPILLIGYFLVARAEGSITLMGYLVNALFFFVGWHYIKQIFGCVIVLSAMKRVYYNRLERIALLLPLYLLWALSYFTSNISGAGNVFYGVRYTAFALPSQLLAISEQTLFVASCLLLAMFIMKYLISRVTPPMSAVIALASLYLWYLPALSHPFYFYIIPLFHSLQYLLFVFAARRNQALSEDQVAPEAEESLATRYNLWGSGLLILLPVLLIGAVYQMPDGMTFDRLIVLWQESITRLSILGVLLVAVTVGLIMYHYRRGKGLAGMVTFFGLAYLLGFLCFALVPLLLDLLVARGLAPGWLSYPAVFGTSLYFFFFTLFLNIHHYFIDNVIWKKENPYVRNYLMYRPNESQTL